MRPKTVGLIAHTGKPGVAELIRELVAAFAETDVKVLVERATAAVAAIPEGDDIASVAKKSDLLVVLGGDGTILNAVGRLEGMLKPIFGINIGSLGFLTCANSSSYQQAVHCIATGKMAFSERILLDITIRKADAVLSRVTALNDVVLSRGEISRLIKLRARVNGEPLTEFNADGLIIATPTGSTAYSLSAGGPIMAPDSGVFVITPICPHVLTNRSVIVADTATLEIEISKPQQPVYLTVDGSDPQRLDPAARVSIKKSAATLSLAAFPETSFFGVVRQKLKWSGSNI